MLAQLNRLTSHEDFTRATKSTIKSSTRSLVGYLLPEPGLTEPKVGFIVSRAIGGSVTRHRVTRQLRHATRESIGVLPKSSLVVIRALRKEQDPKREIPELLNSLAKKATK